MSQSLSGALEESVLTALCWHTELASNIAMKVTADLFQTRSFRVIAQAAIDHVIRYTEAPRNHLPDILESAINRGEAGDQLWKQIGRMEQIQGELQPDYILAELDNWVDNHRLCNTLTEALKVAEKGETSKAKELLYSAKLDADINPGIWMNDPDQALSFLNHNEDEDTFSLGIEALDVRGVRPARKTLLVIMAPKKRGKSTALVHIGKQAAIIERKNVLHITLEMSAEQTAKKYVQSIGGWTSSEADEKTLNVPLFKRDERGGYMGLDFNVLTPDVLDRRLRKEAAQKLLNVTRGRRRLLIKEFPTGQLTIARLHLFLEYLKRTEKFEPDMILLDYANLMHMNSAQIRTETGRVFRDLRGIAVERNIAMVTATQGNRLSESARVVGSTHTAEDWSVAGTCDTMLTICRTPEEKDRRLARIFVACARDVADGYLVSISQAYETSTFCVDSIYMNKLADRDFDKLTRGDDDDE